MNATAATEDRLTILLLEDSEPDADLISEYLSRIDATIEIVRACRREDYLAALGSGHCDIILADYSLPGFDGLSALEIAREHAPGTPFIFVSGVLGEEIAIESFKKGATDYVLKQRLIRLPAAVERALGEAREKAELKRAEEQLQLLVRELSHRVKNTLATVISLVRRTARGSRTVEEYEQALNGRLRALSEAHSLLFEANWQETRLDKVLSRTLEPFRRDGDGSIRAQGPRVDLDPKAALALSMIFHELVTNATKYGALAGDTGLVEASWVIDGHTNGERNVVFNWRESGGPPVAMPTTAGFGTTLIERSIRYELDGEADFGYAESGFTCELRFPAH